MSTFDPPIWIIECKGLQPSHYGPAFSAWENITPERRYTRAEVDEFEQSLSLDDMYGFRWRARQAEGFGIERRMLHWQGVDVGEFTHRVIQCTVHDLHDLHTLRELCDYPIPAPSAWAYMTATLGA
jgi:hypothetical protein